MTSRKHSRFLEKGHQRCLWPERGSYERKKKEVLKTVRMRMPSFVRVRSGVHFPTGLERLSPHKKIGGEVPEEGSSWKGLDDLG